MPTTSYGSINRTYSRRNSAKRKQSTDEAVSEKRRKLSEDEESATITDTEQDDATDEPKASSSRVMHTYGTPKRQRRVAEDFPGIFDHLTPTSSPLPTPTKLAKRMLSRSKTDTVVPESLAPIVERTSSLPNMPSSPVRPPPSTSFAHPEPIAALPIPKTTNTRTYAGRSRSFLVEIPANNLGPNITEEDESTRESYESLRSRWGVDNSEDDPYPAGSPTRSTSSHGTPRKNAKGKGKARQAPIDLPPGMMNPLKSITELRSKGESRRFLDEVGYLFEGLDISGGVGLKRASALEITTKLCDTEFFRKAKAADFFNKTWEVLVEAGAGRGDDRILDTLLVFFTALVSREPTSLVDLAQRSSIEIPDSDEPVERKALIETVLGLLDAPDPLPVVGQSIVKGSHSDEASLRRMGIGKKERQMLTTIYECISTKSGLFPPGTPISASLLIYRTLQTLPASMIPLNNFPTVLSSIRSLIHPLLFSDQSSVSPYLGWPDTAEQIPYQTAYHQLRMLDQYLLGQWGDVDVSSVEEQDQEKEKRRVQKKVIRALDEAREEWLVESLIGLLVCCELRGGKSSSIQGCVEVALRVLVSLTHADENWAQKTLDCEYALGCVLRLVLRSWKEARDAKEQQRMSGSDARSKGKEKMKQEMVEEDEESDEEEQEEEAEEDKAVGAIDRLCLALGVLTNLVQTVEGAKDLFRETMLNQDCDLSKRSCILRCTCTSPIRKDKSPVKSTVNALDILTRIYQAQRPQEQLHNTSTQVKSESPPPPDSAGGETTDTLFLRGHLAVLFGLLMQGCQSNQTYLLQALIGDSDLPNVKKEVLEALVDEAHSFAIFCASLGSAGLNVNTNTNGDVDEEGRVAREVVRFLEGLKDQGWGL